MSFLFLFSEPSSWLWCIIDASSWNNKFLLSGYSRKVFRTFIRQGIDGKVGATSSSLRPTNFPFPQTLKHWHTEKHSRSPKKIKERNGKIKCLELKSFLKKSRFEENKSGMAKVGANRMAQGTQRMDLFFMFQKWFLFHAWKLHVWKNVNRIFDQFALCWNLNLLKEDSLDFITRLLEPFYPTIGIIWKVENIAFTGDQTRNLWLWNPFGLPTGPYKI